MKLKRFILTTEILLIVAPLVLITFVVMNTMVNNLRQEAYSKNLMLARITANHVAEMMNTPLHMLEQLRDHYVTAKVSEDVMVSHMESLVNKYGYFESIELVDKNGVVRAIAPFNESIIHIDRSRQDFFREIRQGREVFWSSSFLSLQTGRPIILLAISAGDMILVGYLDLENISRFSGYFEEKYAQGTSVSITDETGVLLSHHDSQYVSERRYEENLQRLKENVSNEPRIFDYQGVKRLVSLQSVDNLRWYVLVYQDENFAYALVKQLQAIFLATVLGSLFFVLLLSVFKLKNIYQAFDTLKDEMDAIAKGGQSANISEGIFDELNHLAGVFNTMKNSILERQAKDYLIRQVAMRVLLNKPLGDILELICITLSQTCNISFAWAAWANKDGSITSYAASETAVEYLKKVEIRWDDTPAGRGPIGRALRQGTAVKTTVDDEIFTLWASTARQFGVGSLLALPIQVKEGVIGALCLYSPEREFFTEDYVTELSTIVQQIAVAISAYEAYRQLNVLKVSLEAAADGILITDRDGEFVWANKAFANITGYASEDINRAGRDTLLGEAHAGSRPGPESHGVTWFGERERKNGEVYFAEISASAVKDEAGMIIYQVYVIQDITKQKQLERDLENNRRKMARTERVTSLGTMAAGIAHEINQPLNVIKILAGGIELSHELGKLDGVELLKRVREISTQVDRIDSIIRHMRELVFNKRSQTAKPCDVNLVVEKSLNLFKAQLEAHSIQLCLQLQPVKLALAEELTLEEVLINLVNNAMYALDSTDLSEKKISIMTRDEGDRMIIEVADNGPGIDDATKENIFEPFFTTKAVGDGMGLGLSIAHAILTSFGGEISVQDNQPQGAIFRLTLKSAS